MTKGEVSKARDVYESHEQDMDQHRQIGQKREDHTRSMRSFNG